jgi:threonine/homoserine/homoserine lactone efflux protein
MSIILAMCLFALSMSISPGPVNLLTLSTGVNHGFRQAMPFVSGATLGFTLLLLLIGVGIGEIAASSEGFLQMLAYVGSGYICYLGFKIATAKPQIELDHGTRPGLLQGFLLQWLNPKAWMACLSGVSVFNLADSATMLFVFIGVYFVICYASIASWALVGAKIKHLLVAPGNLRLLNLVMGMTLILVACYLFSLQAVDLW